MNIPKTIALRYQLNSFHHWSKPRNLITPETVYSHSGKGVITSVDYRGTKYSVGMVVCLSLLDNGIPIMAIIDSLCKGPSLICSTVDVEFEPHIGSYVIMHTDRLTAKSQLVRVSDLPNKQPMDILYYKNKQVISQRCNLC